MTNYKEYMNTLKNKVFAIKTLEMTWHIADNVNSLYFEAMYDKEVDVDYLDELDLIRRKTIKLVKRHIEWLAIKKEIKC